MFTNYRCYSLSISSELKMPELIQLHGNMATEADVHIAIGDVSKDGLAQGRQLGPRMWASQSALWLQIPGVARFLIRDGKEILIDPEAGADDDTLRLYLQGTAFGAILFQRGLLVLHGNAIRVGDSCMVCVGDSGAGKSTLAAAFMQRGHEILADDVVPIDKQGMALSGFPRIKLWQDAADRLSIGTVGLRRIRAGDEKYHLPTPGNFAEHPLPVRWVYVLNRHPQKEILLDSVLGMERFQLLHLNTYRRRYVKALCLETEHLKRCTQLSERIHIARLTRPEQGNSMDALVARILDDIAAHP